jgi:hypothetical protein
MRVSSDPPDRPADVDLACDGSRRQRGDTTPSRRAVRIAGLVALAVLVVWLGSKLGLGRVATADHDAVAVIIGAGMTVLLLRGVALWWLLRTLAPGVSAWRTLAAYPVTTLVSTLVPGGRAGGAPVNGLVLTRTTGVAYEAGVAASLALGLLTNLAVVAVGGVGVLALLSQAAVGGVVESLVRAFVVVGVAVLLGVLLVRHSSGQLRRWLTTVVVTVAGPLSVIPGVTAPSRARVDQSISTLADALGEYRTRPRTLLLPGTVLVVAHAVTIVALWVALSAFDATVPVPFLMAVVPLAVLAAVVPTPGGLGGVETSLAALISTGSATSASVSAVSVVLYRAGTVLPALVCGGVVLLAVFSLAELRQAAWTR